MTMPGRAVYTSTRSRSRVRSISMRLTAARSSCLRRYSRILMSSTRKSRVLLAVGDPARLPVGDDAEPEPVGVDLLTHYSDLLSVRSASALLVASVFGRRVGSARCPPSAAASTRASPSASASVVDLGRPRRDRGRGHFVVVVVVVLDAGLAPGRGTRRAHPLGAAAREPAAGATGAGRLVAAPDARAAPRRCSGRGRS